MNWLRFSNPWKDRLPGGRADKFLPSAVDPDQLARGTVQEMEHTKDPRIAAEIARDHLVEDERYYSHLYAMERERFRSNPRRKPVKRELHFAGYDFTASPEGTVIHREKVDVSAPGDYGADPLGEGLFRMVPSGDIVDLEESRRRLARRR